MTGSAATLPPAQLSGSLGEVAAQPCFAPADEGAFWRSGGPYGGDVQALALSPDFATDGLALAGGWRTGHYAVTGGYGIVRTTDRGATWESLQDAQHQWAVFDLAISPAFATDHTAFAGTEVGLLRSVDRGATWTSLYNGLPACTHGSQCAMGHVRLSPAFGADGVLLASQWRGALYRSADRGATWTQVLTSTVTAAAFARDFVANQTVFAAQFDGVGTTHLLRSTDGGLTWVELLNLPATSINDILETVDGALLLAADGGVLRFVPAGGGYAADVVSPNVGGAGNRLAVAGDNVYAATQNGLFISMSYGRGWERVAAMPATPVRAVAPCPHWGSCHAVMAGTHTGILATPDDNLQPWTWLNGPHALLTNSVVASPAYASDGTLFASTDHGVFRSTDRGASWQLMLAGDPPGDSYTFPQVRLSAAYATDGTVFATYEGRTIPRAGLYKSTDQGETWTSQFGVGGGRALALSPAYDADQTLFVGTGDVLHKSSDGGNSWSSYPIAAPGDDFFVFDLEASPAYATDQTLFATGFGQARRSTDGGVTWQALEAPGPSYGLAISPHYAADGTVWETYRAIESLGEGTPESGISRSTDGGATWHWATAGLPGDYEPFPIPLAVSPGYATDSSLFTALSGQFVAGTSHSLYRSTNGGDTWLDLGPAPGNPNPYDLAITVNPAGGLTAHVATAAGVWHYSSRCEERLVNGGFEQDLAWQIPHTAHPASYSTMVAHSGTRSMLAGVVAAPDVFSYSDAYQTVTIPSGIVSATLHLEWYPVSAEGPLATSAATLPAPDVLRAVAAGTLPGGVLAGDRQYVLLLNDHGAILTAPLWTRDDAQAWQELNFDLTPYKGLTLQVRFGVYNDGDGDSTAMYVDDAAVVVCWPATPAPTPTPTASPTPGPVVAWNYLPLMFHNYIAPVPPTPTSTPTPGAPLPTETATPTFTASPTPTPTASATPTATSTPAAPTPTATATPTVTPTSAPTGTPTVTSTPTVTPGSGCYEGLVNGDFEERSGWTIRSNPVLAEYVAAPVHGGAWSMRTGIAAGGANVESYSPIEQAVTFPDLPSPGTLSSAQLSFWRYNVYSEAAGDGADITLPDQSSLPRTEAELSTASFSADFFYVIAIQEDGTLDWLLVERTNAPSWRQQTIDVSHYAGQQVRLQFGTYNNGTGGISRTYVDDVSLQICLPEGASPTPTLQPPTATPTATATATATPNVIPTAEPGTWPTPYLWDTLDLGEGIRPYGIALSPAGDWAYLALHVGGDYGKLGVVQTGPVLMSYSEISLASVPTEPNGVAVLNDSGLVAVANRATSDVAIVDVNAEAVVDHVPADLLPDGVVVQGDFSYVANFGNDTVTVFDTAGLGVTGTLHVGHEPALFAGDPTTGDVYLSLHGANQVLRLHDGTVVGQYNSIPEPYGVAFDPVNRRLYAANRGSYHTVTVIDVTTGTVIGTIDTGVEPFVLTVNPASGHLFVACGDQVQVYRTLDWSPVTTIPVPPGAEEGVALDSVRNRVYVTSHDGNALTVIQDVAPPLVLFASNRTGNSEIYRMLPDGQEQIRLTDTTDLFENSPAGSPNGRWIAYERTDAAEFRHIWVMSRDGLNAHQVTAGARDDLHPTWSPDGTQLAFASSRDGNWELYTIHLDPLSGLKTGDGALTRLTFNSAADLNPDYSWATGRIAFQSNRIGPNAEIFSMAPDGSDVQRMTVNPNGDCQPSWSPTDERIVFNGNRAEQTLYTLQADGVTILPLVPRSLRPSSPSWAPASVGGAYIVFSGYRPGSGHSEIFRVAPDGSGLVLLTFNEVDSDYAPGWLP